MAPASVKGGGPQTEVWKLRSETPRSRCTGKSLKGELEVQKFDDGEEEQQQQQLQGHEPDIANIVNLTPL